MPNNLNLNNTIGHLIYNQEFIPITQEKKCIELLLTCLTSCPKITKIYPTYDLDDNLITSVYQKDGIYYTNQQMNEYVNREENRGKNCSKQFNNVDILSSNTEYAIHAIKESIKQTFPDSKQMVITSRTGGQRSIPSNFQESGLSEILTSNYFCTLSKRRKPKMESFIDAKKYYALAHKLEQLNVPINGVLAYMLNQIIKLNQVSIKDIIINISKSPLKLHSKELAEFKTQNTIDDKDFHLEFSINPFDENNEFNNLENLNPKKDEYEETIILDSTQGSKYLQELTNKGISYTITPIKPTNVQKTLAKLFNASEQECENGLIINIQLEQSNNNSQCFLVKDALSNLMEDDKSSTLTIHSGDSSSADVGLSIQQKKAGYNSIGIFNLTNTTSDNMKTAFTNVKELYSNNGIQSIEKFYKNYKELSQELNGKDCTDKDNLYNKRRSLINDLSTQLSKKDLDSLNHLAFAQTKDSEDAYEKITTLLTPNIDKDTINNLIQTIQKINYIVQFQNKNSDKKTLLTTIESAKTIPLFMVENMDLFAQSYNLSLKAASLHNKKFEV